MCKLNGFALICFQVHVLLRCQQCALADEVCEKETGGTCFFRECNSRRNSTCTLGGESGSMKLFGVKISVPMPWKSCMCSKGDCAGRDGLCHQHRFKNTFAATLRTELSDELLLMFIMLGRSGCLSYVCQQLGLDRIFENRISIPTDYSTVKTWDEQRTEMRMTRKQAVGSSLFKLVCWHMWQIAWFILSYHAYSPLMDTYQFAFATGVVVKEGIYLVILIVGLVVAPQFLLFCPLSDNEQAFRIAYFLSPDAFVADTIEMQNIRIISWMVKQMAYLSAALSLASWCSLFVGMGEFGAMTPALAFGYILSGLTPVGLVWALKSRLRRRVTRLSKSFVGDYVTPLSPCERNEVFCSGAMLSSPSKERILERDFTRLGA